MSEIKKIDSIVIKRKEETLNDVTEDEDEMPYMLHCDTKIKGWQINSCPNTKKKRTNSLMIGIIDIPFRYTQTVLAFFWTIQKG